MKKQFDWDDFIVKHSDILFTLILIVTLSLCIAAFTIVYSSARKDYEPVTLTATVSSVGEDGAVLSYANGYGEMLTLRVSSDSMSEPLSIGDKVECTYNDGFVALLEDSNTRS